MIIPGISPSFKLMPLQGDGGGLRNTQGVASLALGYGILPFQGIITDTLSNRLWHGFTVISGTMRWYMSREEAG